MRLFHFCDGLIPGAIRNHEYVLTRKHDGDELYHLLNDSVQQNNLAQKMPDQVNTMVTLYEQWLTEVTSDGLQPPVIEVGHEDVPVVEFPSPDASKFHNLKFKGGSGWANDWFIDWQQGSQAIWKAKAVSDMEYQVFLELSSPAGLNQQFSLTCSHEILNFSIESPVLATEVPNHDRVMRGEVEEKEWPMVNIGALRMAEGDHELILQAETPMDSLLEIKSIKLIPTS